MADKPTKYDPAKSYEVTFARRVKLGGAPLPLLGNHEVTGAALNQIVAEYGADAVASAKALS